VSTTDFTVKPVTSARWPALEDLFRRSGASTLIEAAGPAGAPVLEAYPVDTSVPSHTGNLFPGIAAVFAPARLPGRGPA
jgi:hypothetical protein